MNISSDSRFRRHFAVSFLNRLSFPRCWSARHPNYGLFPEFLVCMEPKLLYSRGILVCMEPWYGTKPTIFSHNCGLHGTKTALFSRQFGPYRCVMQTSRRHQPQIITGDDALICGGERAQLAISGSLANINKERCLTIFGMK